jgi:parallel beta-helix repeat protein
MIREQVIGNFIHNIGNPSLSCNRVHGVYCASAGCLIQDNIVFNNQSWGSHLWHAATNATISGNTVHSNSYGGILIGAVSSDFPSGSGTNQGTSVRNNAVFSNGLLAGAQGYGIGEYGDTGVNTYSNNAVYNNGPANWNLQNGNTHSGDITATPLLCASAVVTYSGCQ